MEKYLNAMSGLWCVNVGYGRQELARAAQLSKKKCGKHVDVSHAPTKATFSADKKGSTWYLHLLPSPCLPEIPSFYSLLKYLNELLQIYERLSYSLHYLF